MGKRKFPEHIGTSRQFKAKVRRRLALAAFYLDAAQLGIAYAPAGASGKVMDAVRLIDLARQACSAKNWGR